MGLYILFRWSHTPVRSQLVFCMHFCVWRYSPDVSVERDVLHVYLLLRYLIHSGRFFTVWAPRDSQESFPTPQFKSINSLALTFIVQLSHPYMTTGKTIAFTGRTFVSNEMSLLFYMLSRLLIAFLSRSKHFLISWLQSPFAVILESKKIKSVTVPIVSPSICPEVVGTAEKAMAPHSSTLAWKIPWMEKPGRLQSLGSLRVDMTERLYFHFSLSCIGEGNGNPLQCSCLENPRDGGAW